MAGLVPAIPLRRAPNNSQMSASGREADSSARSEIYRFWPEPDQGIARDKVCSPE